MSDTLKIHAVEVPAVNKKAARHFTLYMSKAALGINDLPKKGESTERPTSSLTTDDAGFQYFDTTLGKYICWDGTDWINMDGTALG